MRQRFGDENGIRKMAAAGFDAIDYTFNEMVSLENIWNSNQYEQYGQKLLHIAEEEGICFNQAHAPFLFDWDAMWLSPKFETCIFPVIKRSIECAAILHIPLIVVHPIHHIRYRGNETMLWDWNQEYYARVLEVAQEYNIKIALENMWQTDPKRNCGDSDVFSTPVRFRDFLDSLHHPQAVACVDVGHAGLAGEDPVNLLCTLGGKRVRAVHIHDNAYHMDDHTLPYLGKLNWNEITKALGQIDYQGDFTFEVTNYLTPFDDEMVDQALRFQVSVGRHLMDLVEESRKNKNGKSFYTE